MNNTKKEPFQEDPDLVKTNFLKILEAYKNAPPADKEQAVTEVLRQISQEQSA